MADLKISELTDGNSIASANSLMEIAQGSNSRSLKFSDLLGPIVMAKSAVNQSILATTWSKINFGTEEIDSHNKWDGNQFQPNMAGIYSVAAYSEIDTSNKTSLAIYKNGSVYKFGMAGEGYASVCGLISLSGNDYCSIYAWAEIGVNLIADNRTFVDIHKVYKL